MEKTIILDGKNLTVQCVIDIAQNHCKVDIPSEIKEVIIEKRKKLEDQLEKYPKIKIYGTNRLHGDLKYIDVNEEDLRLYQEKYIKVHNCGTGPVLSKEVVRAIMAIRLNSFAKTLSGMRWETMQLIMDMLNHEVTPVVMEEGSVGASGDLIPLAMIGAVMIGLPEAEAFFEGRQLSAREALEKAGLNPLELGAKEAMGLTNGSTFIAAFAAFAVRDAQNLIQNASIASALSLEAIRGEPDAFSELINDNRPHKGQQEVASQLRKLIKGSKRLTPAAQLNPFGNRENANAFEDIRNANISQSQKEFIEKFIKKNIDADVRVQDRYSFRAIPPVHGAVVEAIARLKEVVEIEINSATDNPLFGEVGIEEMRISEENYSMLKNDGIKKMVKGFSGANFHGQPLAVVIDYLKIAITGLGLISDKRSFSLLNERLSYGLPADLAYNTRKADGGLMIAQYAGAARAAENRVLSTPSSIMSLSTAANQEDFVSMGANGALHLRKVIENTQKIIAVELLCALRALQLTWEYLPEHLRPLGEGTRVVYEYLSSVDGLEGAKVRLEDHYLRLDLEKMIGIVKSAELIGVL